VQSIREGGIGLGINVNVANCAFWLSQDFEQIVREYIRAYKREWENSKSSTTTKTLGYLDAYSYHSRLS
jgi:hypothetical protein